MNESTKRGFSILGVALVLGILADCLLKVIPWGLNLLLWVGALVVGLFALARWQRIALEGEGRWLLPLVLFCAIGVAWRDSTTLKVFDVFALLIALGLAAVRSRTGQIRLAGIADYLLGLFFAGLNAAFGTILLVFKDIHWREMPCARWMTHTRAILRGLLIAVPLLFIFGGLFMAADAGFEQTVHRIFRLDTDAIIQNAFVIGFWTWIVGGILRRLLQPEEMIKTSVPTTLNKPALGMVEAGLVLGLLNALFLAFVCSQLPYFFGGQAHVMAIRGLTSADYARRGFFELVTVAVLVLPMLLFADWLLKKDAKRDVQLFRALAGTLILLLFVIMASALQRMWLYSIGYGFTELRFYTTAFMGWLAIVFVWFALTVLRGQRQRFIFGAMVSGFATLALLHVMNPDGFIVRANVARIRSGRVFDAGYAAQLSADAVPDLLKALPHLSPDERAHVVETLEKSDANQSSDWCTWSVSRAMARHALGQASALR
ncbi:MAG TPA: DUF4173 domain-containing protein [Chthonomonadaceae bacterium]|nr:DUF4173 domain-containing protein [Chthonomonadaceae bacterium]